MYSAAANPTATHKVWNQNTIDQYLAASGWACTGTDHGRRFWTNAVRPEVSFFLPDKDPDSLEEYLAYCQQAVRALRTSKKNPVFKSQ